MVAIWGRVVLCDLDLGVLVSKERTYEDIGTNVNWLDGGIQIDRIKSEKYILLVHIIYRKCDVFNPNSWMFVSDDFNIRLTFLVHGGWGIGDHKTDVLEDGAGPLHIFVVRYNVWTFDLFKYEAEAGWVLAD